MTAGAAVGASCTINTSESIAQKRISCCDRVAQHDSRLVRCCCCLPDPRSKEPTWQTSKRQPWKLHRSLDRCGSAPPAALVLARWRAFAAAKGLAQRASWARRSSTRHSRGVDHKDGKALGAKAMLSELLTSAPPPRLLLVAFQVHHAASCLPRRPGKFSRASALAVEACRHARLVCLRAEAKRPACSARGVLVCKDRHGYQRVSRRSPRCQKTRSKFIKLGCQYSHFLHT